VNHPSPNSCRSSYDELRRIAAGYVRGRAAGQTIQATALVNEAFVRLAGERARQFNGRTHFLAIAALSMRQILVQRARSRNAIKRGGGPQRVTLVTSTSRTWKPASAGLNWPPRRRHPGPR
jgi:RNA polymerase sigma factor (TIGR02999 family)